MMHKCRKIEPKWDQNGSQNVTEIGKSWKNEGPKNDAKNRCNFRGGGWRTGKIRASILGPAGGVGGGTVLPD